MKSSLMLAVASATAAVCATATAQPQGPAPAPSIPAPAPATTSDPPASAGPEVLTLERAIEIAMKQQPSLRQSKAQLEVAQGRIDQSRVARLPTINLSASATANSAQVRPCAGNPTKDCGGFFDPTAGTGLSAQARWT